MELLLLNTAAQLGTSFFFVEGTGSTLSYWRIHGGWKPLLDWAGAHVLLAVLGVRTPSSVVPSKLTHTAS